MEVEAKEMEEEKSNPQPNCFLFCLEVTCRGIERICLAADHHGYILLENEDVDMMHRAVYSLLMVLDNAEGHREMILSILQRENIDVLLDHFHSNLPEDGHSNKVLSLITHFLTNFNTHNKEL